MAKFYVESRQFPSINAFFESRAQTARGLVRAAYKALYPNHNFYQDLFYLESTGYTNIDEFYASCIEVWRTETRGGITRLVIGKPIWFDDMAEPGGGEWC